MLLNILFVAKRGEELRKELQEKYRDHRSTSYKLARMNLYNDVECNNDEVFRLYTIPFKSKCHVNKKIPSDSVANAEHIVPQSLFDKKEPYVSDLHHLYSSGRAENGRRSNYAFGEFPYEKCKTWCINLTCVDKKPENEEEWNCLSSGPTLWMPIKRDRGTIARAVLYFQTVYPEIDISSVNNISLYLKWNREYPPTQREMYRNDMVNITQGNRNPYVDNYILADRVFA